MVEVLIAIIAFVPALISNSLAVVFGGGKPIDAGRTWRGRRILGDGKTWRGLLGGGLGAGLIGVTVERISEIYFSTNIYPDFPYSLLVILTFSFGALFGDIGASFIKRRRGVSRGEKFPLLDMFDFVIGAFLLSILLNTQWTLEIYFNGNGWIATAILIIVVPLLHRSVNIIGYKLGLKNEPW